MRRAVSVVCLGFVAAGWLGSLAAAGELPTEIAEPYAAAVRQMQSVYSNTTVEGKLSQFNPSSGAWLDQSFTYRAAGQRVRLDVTSLPTKGNYTSTPGVHHMYMATPYGSLDTVQGSRSPAFDDADQDRYGQTRSKMSSLCPLSAAYALDPASTLLDMLKSPSVRIVKVEKIKNDKGQFVRIVFEQATPTKEHPDACSGWLLVSPEEGWGLRQYVRETGRSGEKLIEHGSIRYSGDKNGVPLVSSIETKQERGGVVLQHEKLSVTKFKPGQVADHYFTADAF